MVKGFKDAKDNFHPITQSKGVRSRRDTSQKTQGVVIRKQRDNNAEILRNTLVTFNRQFPVKVEYGDAGGKSQGLKFEGTHSFIAGKMTRSEAIDCLDFTRRFIDELPNERKKRIDSKEMLSPTGEVKVHLEKHSEGIRLKRTTGFPAKTTGLNKVAVIELMKGKGGSYDPPLYQVNVNGKGAYFPAHRELAETQAESVISDAKFYDVRGRKIN